MWAGFRSKSLEYRKWWQWWVLNAETKKSEALWLSCFVLYGLPALKEVSFGEPTHDLWRDPPMVRKWGLLSSALWATHRPVTPSDDFSLCHFWGHLPERAAQISPLRFPRVPDLQRLWDDVYFKLLHFWMTCYATPTVNSRLQTLSSDFDMLVVRLTSTES